tara:strand:+ start:505 stop:1842 length:1338 start_codon:yes stop_codon:yes gene_type:complete
LSSLQNSETSLAPVRVGIVGIGTVGGGTLKLLTENAAEIERRLGRALQITRLGARRDPKGIDISGYAVERDPMAVARATDVDILVETIGGTTVARELVLLALQHGKHVVTANKALIAEHGEELLAAAAEQKVSLVFEASVAGGIPIIRALREGLAANSIDWLAGIINGTSNYILSAMQQESKAFAPTLKEAQDLGYAEADPTFDVEGIDAAHKLCILASCAFGVPLDFQALSIEGISNITLEDIQYADELGYTIKHLGIAKRTDAGIDLRVHPTLVPKANLLASVNGVMNSVLVQGNAVGPTFYTGAGAGSLPTASSVVGDIIEVARGFGETERNSTPSLGFTELKPQALCSAEESTSSFYLRMTLTDEIGALAGITSTLAEFGISVEAMLQKEPRMADGEALATLIVLTHEVSKGAVDKALAKIKDMAVVRSDVTVMRMEQFQS